MEKPSSQVLFTTGLALQLGFSIALPLILFIALGIWFDRRWGTLPLFTVAGVILALAVSVTQIYQVIKSTQQRQNPKSKIPNPKP